MDVKVLALLVKATDNFRSLKLKVLLNKITTNIKDLTSG